MTAAPARSSPTGFIAVLAGWITTEVGRQPYTVYGLLRTAQSVSPVEASLVAFIVVYFVAFSVPASLHLPAVRASAPARRADVEKGVPVRAAGTPAPALDRSPGR